MVPTPAAARYRSAGEPRPPAPIVRIFASRILVCPASPTSGRIRCREYRSRCAAATALTVDDDLGSLIGEDILDPALEVGPGEVPGAGDDPVRDLIVLTDVQKGRLAGALEAGENLLGGGLSDLPLDLLQQIPKISHIRTLQYG